MISKSFLKSSLLFTIGGALPMLGGIILLPFYTNYLSDRHYTQILFYISLSMLFQILFSFSIENYYGMRYTRLSEQPAEQKRFTGTVSMLLLAIGFLVLSLSSLFGERLFSLVYVNDLGMEFWPWGFYSVLTAFFNAYFKAASIVLIYQKRPYSFLISNVLNFIVTVGVSVSGLFMFPDSIQGPIYGRLFSGLLIFGIALFIFERSGQFGFERSFLPDLFRFCVPYMFFVLSAWVLMQIDRYVLQLYIPNAELNAYDLLLKCFYGIEFIQNSLSAVIYPKVFEIWNKTKKHETTAESNRYFNVFSALNVIQLLLFCLAMPLVYRLFIHNPVFFQSESYIGILAAGYSLRSILSFYMAGILFTGKVNVLVKVFGVSAVFQVLLTWPLSMSYGLNGAILAGLLTKVLQVWLCARWSAPVFTFSFNKYKIVVLPFVYLLLNAVFFAFVPSYSLWFYLVQFIGFGLLIYALFRNEIRKVLQSFGWLPLP